MTYKAFLQLFENILANPDPPPPYNNPDYLAYTKLNFSRTRRWYKTAVLNPQLVHRLQTAPPLHWIGIVEPWCGDVAPSLPFIMKLLEAAPQHSYDLQLRDSEPFLINQYLTGSSKSIPKVIVRDGAGSDVLVWGPRPAGAQALVDSLKEKGADFETLKTELQNWYNADEGRSLQQELLQGLHVIG